MKLSLFSLLPGARAGCQSSGDQAIRKPSMS